MTGEELQAFMSESAGMLQHDPGAFADMVRLARAVAKDALVWPRVVAKPSESEDEITVDDIPVEDLLDIMNFALNETPVQAADGEVPAAALASFPEDERVQGGGGSGTNVLAAAQ